MAIQSRRTCAASGCSALALLNRTRCAAHAGKERDRERERSKGKSIYLDARYRKARAVFMAEHPLCVTCGALATDLDHVVPHKGDTRLFWDEGNWQALCASCHSVKTAAEDGGFGNARRGGRK